MIATHTWKHHPDGSISWEPIECQTFTPAEGAAWPWCDTCGTRADLHRGNDERTAGYRKAVHRIVHR